MPDVSAGNPQRVYVLGARGREFINRDLGLSVDRGFRPDEGRHLSFTQVRHNLALTRFLVAARKWAETREDFSLSEARICYDLASVTGEVDKGGGRKREPAPVVPDAWLLFEKTEGGGAPIRSPVLIEIDRGTMYKERIKKHVGARVDFVLGGGYKQMFGTEAVTIAYVAIGEEERRQEALTRWTRELLKETRRESWGQAFRFGSAPLRFANVVTLHSRF